MTLRYLQAAFNLLTFGASTVVLLFANFLFSRGGNAPILGITLPHRWVHAVLGPVLLIINGAVLVLLLAVALADVDAETVALAQNTNKLRVLGPLLNPVWPGTSLLNSLGYGALIILWWLGMHGFLYSVRLNEADGDLLASWQIVVSGLYLVIGLSTMITIQAIWQSWGIDQYQTKVWVSFIGIAVGAFGPPLLLGLGTPSILRG